MKQYQVLKENCTQAGKVIGSLDETEVDNDCHIMDIEDAVKSILNWKVGNSGDGGYHNRRCGLNVLRYHFYYDGCFDDLSDNELEVAVKVFCKN